jgi:hypothetical protein
VGGFFGAQVAREAVERTMSPSGEFKIGRIADKRREGPESPETPEEDAKPGA